LTQRRRDAEKFERKEEKRKEEKEEEISR